MYEPASDILANRENDAFKIAFHFSNFFAEELSKSRHSFTDKTELEKRLVKNGYRGSIAYIDDLVKAYGFDY